MQLKSLGAVALASLALATSVQAAEPTPQAVTDMFLKSIVHIDAKSMEALNAYLRPARTFPGQGDFINVKEMLEVDRDYAKEMAATFLENVKLSDADKKALEPAAVQLFANVRDSQKRITCTMGQPQKVTEGVHAEMLAVNVPFKCLAPNPPEKVVAFLQRAGGAKWDLAQYRENVQTLAKGFEAAAIAQGDGLAGLVVKMDQGGFGGHRQLVPLPGFLPEREGAGADAADPGLDQYLLAVEQLPFELHRVARDDQMPVVHIQLGGEDAKQRVAGRFKPDRRHRVVDVAEGICLLKTGLDLHFQHGYRLLVVGPRSG